MLFPVTSLCLVACLAAAFRREGGRSPVVLGLLAWAVSLLLASPIIFAYAVDYSLKADLFAGACLVAVTAGYLLCRRAARTAPETYFNRLLEIRIAKQLGAAGAFGCLLLLADARLNGGLQFSASYLIETVGTIRTDAFERLASGDNRGLLGTAGGLLAPCAVLNVLAAARLGREADGALRWLGRVNFALVAAVSLMVFAGRATVINLVLLVIVGLFLRGRRFSPFRPRAIIVGTLLLIGALYFSTSFLSTRQEKANSVAILEETQRAQVRPWIAPLSQGNAALGFGMVSLGYFGSPLPTLHYYTAAGPVPGPFYGGYTFQLPARIVGSVAGTYSRDGWSAVREEVFAPLESRNYHGNVWATWLRDLLVDFGYLGAVVFCALFGGFMAWARNRYQLTGGLHYHYLETIACFTFSFGAFTSFMFTPFLAYPFFLTLALMVVVRGSRSPALTRPAQRAKGFGQPGKVRP